MLERARKAEAEVISLKSQLKNETTTSKKTIRDMESSLTECTARTQKAEREYAVLRDSIKGLVSSFERDAVSLREEMARREEKLKTESEEMGRKYRSLLEAVRKERESGGLGEVRWLLHENKRIAENMEVALKEELCPQESPLVPSANGELWKGLSDKYSTKEFLLEAVEWLGGAVRVPCVPLRLLTRRPR